MSCYRATSGGTVAGALECIFEGDDAQKTRESEEELPIDM